MPARHRQLARSSRSGARQGDRGRRRCRRISHRAKQRASCRGVTVHSAVATDAVVESTEQSAVVRARQRAAASRRRWHRRRHAGCTTLAKRLSPPRPPEAFTGQWPDAVLPSTRQSPAPVALGRARVRRACMSQCSARRIGARDGTSQDGSVEGRVDRIVRPAEDRPLAADLDVAGRLYLSGSIAARTRRCSCGLPSCATATRDPRFALGRLRYAASSLGMLDGGRAALHTGNVELAAFGGLVPDPLERQAGYGRARFGAEAIYDRVDAPWQPRVAVTAYGSTWQGSVDERRLSVVSSASHEALRLDGWAELQSFPSNNQFDAKALELTGAGTTVEWRKRGRHAGIDISYLGPSGHAGSPRPCPSNGFAPLCTSPAISRRCAGALVVDDRECIGRHRWPMVERRRHRLGDMGRRRVSRHRGSGYLRGELRHGPARAEAAVSGGKASFAAWTAAELGGAYVPSPAVSMWARATGRSCSTTSQVPDPCCCTR